jgi:hypothetical protein
MRKTDQDVTGWQQPNRLLSIRLRGRKAPGGPRTETGQAEVSRAGSTMTARLRRWAKEVQG